jgi:hypothetical protein
LIAINEFELDIGCVNSSFFLSACSDIFKVDDDVDEAEDELDEVDDELRLITVRNKWMRDRDSRPHLRIDIRVSALLKGLISVLRSIDQA